MQHDAINAAVLTAGKSVTGKLGGIARQTSTLQAKLIVPGMPASHRRRPLKFIQRFAGYDEFMKSLPIPATNRDAS
jgi:hypothetical protein